MLQESCKKTVADKNAEVEEVKSKISCLKDGLTS